MRKRKVGRWSAALLSPASCVSWPQAAAATTTRPAERGDSRRDHRRGPEGMLQTLGEGEGQVNLIAWAGYVEDGSHGPEGGLGDGLREGDRLPGQHEGRQHVRRDGDADAHRPYDGVSASGDATLR